ncbi:MAG: hypothetical protein WD771_07670 [Gemmatimonadaceae bacterium]
MAQALQIVSHWHHSVENLTASSLDFYKEIEKALTAKKVDVRTERVTWREGGLFSNKREYLRVTYDRFVFDIGASPFGTDFFFSWWLGTYASPLVSLPVIGFLYSRLAKPNTYYSEDTRVMFEETIHRVVLDIVSGILTLNKMTPLTPTERVSLKHKQLASFSS